MATKVRERAARLSVLDRLIDQDPRAPEDPPVTRAHSVRRVKAGLLRDLEWLLNSRRTPAKIPEACVELRRSVFAYGLPDTTSLSSDSPAVRLRLQREIEDCIRCFEPRLEAVEVQLIDEKTRFQRFRFVVDAILRLDPDAERIRLDGVLDVARGDISMTGDPHA